MPGTRLAILLPVTSRLFSSAEAFCMGIASCVSAVEIHRQQNVSFVVGVDADEPCEQQLRETLACSAAEIHFLTLGKSSQENVELGRAANRQVAHTLTCQANVPSSEEIRKPAVPICEYWNQMALHACHSLKCHAFLLLGDDIKVEPDNWVALITDFLDHQPATSLLVLRDAADPGFPSFLVIRASHFDHFERLLPKEFINQDGDPFLMELYRSIGGVSDCMDVIVTNGRGGPQLSNNQHYAPPSYLRRHVPKATFDRLLHEWQAQLLRSSPKSVQQHLTLDILIPSMRADPALLGPILATPCTEANVSLRFLIQLEPGNVQQANMEWLLGMQKAMGHSLRVRHNATQLGAPLNRNKLLDASYADYVIFFDDDVVPDAGCIDAYVRAFRSHPDAAGFAGPTFLPHDGLLLSSAIHMSDVSFFWEAPVHPSFPFVPWAISANFAFKARDSQLRFSEAYPKAGGGEDIDFCLRLSQALISVPGARCGHPLWPHLKHIFTHPFNWARGDGHLISQFPKQVYYRVPNSVELLCLALLLATALSWVAPQAARMSVAVAVLTLIVDIAQDALCKYFKDAEKRHQDASGLKRVAAAVLAAVIVKVSRLGRIVGHLQRWERGLCMEFDWFCGMLPGVVQQEQRKAFCAFVIQLGVAIFICMRT